MKSESIKIAGMSCGHCVMAVKKELAKLQLRKAEVTIGQADVEYDETKVSRENLLRAIEEAGYQVID